MPDLFLAYGNALEQDQTQAGVVLLTLMLATTAILALFTAGAIAQAIERAVHHRLAQRHAHR